MSSVISLAKEILRPRVFISGESGGTGASTTAKLLSEILGVPVISGGKYFRALAYQYEVFRQEQLQCGENLTELEMYEQFLSQCLVIFEQHQLIGLLQYLQAGIQLGANGEVLANFSAAIAKVTQHQEKIDPFWDHFVDQSTLREALSLPGFILESKLAILKMQLDESQTIVSEFHGFAIPFLKVLLQLEPEIAAQRISQRENRPVKKEEVLLRQQRDFARYAQLYHLNGQSVSFQDLAKLADVKIDTNLTPPDLVVEKVLFAYIEKLAQLDASQTELNEALIYP